MFLRKLLGNESKNGGGPPGMHTMGGDLQRKFAKGVQYNMKIIIKGDRNVGKSCLLLRLEGKPFRESYLPSDEIQVANIIWPYKATNDVIKVEVWDVVDKGKKKKKMEGLKLDTADSMMNDDSCLDASFVDVYKGTHGILLVMDITKQWTFDYVEREISLMPPTVPILIVANHRDMGHHRVITEDQILSFIEHLDRPKGAAKIRHVETSMKSGFGLKYIHKFFSLPFLHLQRETLLRQLETNEEETQMSYEELSLHEESDEQSYDKYLEVVASRQAEGQKGIQQGTEVVRQEDAVKRRDDPAPTLAPTRALPATSPGGTTAGKEASSLRPTLSPSVASMLPGTAAHSPVTRPVEPAVALAEAAAGKEKPARFMSRFFGSGKQQAAAPVAVKASAAPEPMSTTPVGNVDEFSPEGEEGLDPSFLELDAKMEGKQSPALARRGAGPDSSDSGGEEPGINPLVAGFQDDLDSEEEQHSIPPHSTTFPSGVQSSNEKADKKLSAAFTSDVAFFGKDSSLSRTNPTAQTELSAASEKDRKKNAEPAASLRANPTPVGIVHPSLPGASIQQSEISTQPSSRSKEAMHQGNVKKSGAASSGAIKWAANVTEPPPDSGGGSSSEGEGADGPPQVLQDLEDVDEDISVSSIGRQSSNEMQVESDGAEVVVDESAQDVEIPSQPLYTLNFDDLSLLEKRYDPSLALPAQSVAVSEPTEELSSSKAKKHSHKSKKEKKTDKDDDEPRKERKHRKHKERINDGDKATRSAIDDGSGDAVTTEKSKKSRSKKEDRKKSEENDLEAFLGLAGPYESL